MGVFNRLSRSDRRPASAACCAALMRRVVISNIGAGYSLLVGGWETRPATATSPCISVSPSMGAGRFPRRGRARGHSRPRCRWRKRPTRDAHSGAPRGCGTERYPHHQSRHLPARATRGPGLGPPFPASKWPRSDDLVSDLLDGRLSTTTFTREFDVAIGRLVGEPYAQQLSRYDQRIVQALWTILRAPRLTRPGRRAGRIARACPPAASCICFVRNWASPTVGWRSGYGSPRPSPPSSSSIRSRILPMSSDSRTVRTSPGPSRRPSATAHRRTSRVASSFKSAGRG